MRRWLALLLMFCASSAAAIDDMGRLEDPALQTRYERLTNELRCLVCQNQSIADSTADLAADLRVQVREMLLSGASDREILDYMVARYGDFVRYRPGFNPRTWMLWFGPFIAMALGLGIAAIVIVRRTREPQEAVE